MEYQSAENVQAGMIRVGIVTDVNKEKLIARVKFPETGMESGWLQILDRKPFIPDYPENTDEQRTEYDTGGSGEAAYENHRHKLIIKPWAPDINEQVLTVYLPMRDGDGFILGGLKPWQ